MFTDWQQALEAEGLLLNPNSVEQQADAVMIRKAVIEAYDAAHQAPAAKAS